MPFHSFLRKIVLAVRPLFVKIMPQTDLYGYSPYRGYADSYCLPKHPHDFDGHGPQGLPVPPEWLRFGYRTSEGYLQSGQKDMAAMLETCPIDDARRILDFGCGSGRMIRWLKDYAADREIWGTDINADYVTWCQQHLSPPFHFALTTTLPHLPFEDRYFDYIYAGSVFTHLDDLATAWMLELRRILSPGGRMYITIHDENTLALLSNEYKDHPSARAFRRRENFDAYTQCDFGMFSLGRRTNSQVFYNSEYFRKWVASLNLKVVSVTPGMYRYQTGVVLQRAD